MHVVNIHLVHQAYIRNIYIYRFMSVRTKYNPPQLTLTNIDPAKQKITLLYMYIYIYWRFSGFMLVGRMVHHVHHIL